MTHPDLHHLMTISLVDRIIVVICFMLALGLGAVSQEILPAGGGSAPRPWRQ
jgi:hypothetical protein